nr:MAG TPA: hypothetical protein [Caudoviricetes sp.]
MSLVLQMPYNRWQRKRTSPNLSHIWRKRLRG